MFPSLVAEPCFRIPHPPSPFGSPIPILILPLFLPQIRLRVKMPHKN